MLHSDKKYVLLLLLKFSHQYNAIYFWGGLDECHEVRAIFSSIFTGLLAGLSPMEAPAVITSTVNACASTLPRIRDCAVTALPCWKARRPPTRQATVARAPIGTKGSALNFLVSFWTKVSGVPSISMFEMFPWNELNISYKCDVRMKSKNERSVCPNEIFARRKPAFTLFESSPLKWYDPFLLDNFFFFRFHIYFLKPRIDSSLLVSLENYSQFIEYYYLLFWLLTL